MSNSIVCFATEARWLVYDSMRARSTHLPVRPIIFSHTSMTCLVKVPFAKNSRTRTISINFPIWTTVMTWPLGFSSGSVPQIPTRWHGEGNYAKWLICSSAKDRRKWYSVEKTEISLKREKLDESVCFTEMKLFHSKLQKIQHNLALK